MTDNENSNAQQTEQATNSKNGLLLGGALVVIIGGLAGWMLLKGDPAPEPIKVAPPPIVVAQPQPPAPEPESVKEPEPEPEPVVTEPEPIPEPVKPKVILPDLEKSDPVIYKELTDLSWHQNFAALFVNKDIIRHFVVFTDNVASGNLVRNFAAFKPPISRFKVAKVGDTIVIDDSSFERYDMYLTILNSVQPEDLLALFNKFQPLVKEVYDEIGYPDHDFKDTLIQAIDHVLDTPIIEGPIELTSAKVMYDFKDPKLQALTAVQKQVLRLGGKNVKKLKPLLRRYRALLAQ